MSSPAHRPRTFSVSIQLAFGMALGLAFFTCEAQEPYFGQQGLWERSSKATNQTFDGKPSPPSESKEKKCSQDARLAGSRDPFFETINRTDPTCAYTDVKGSPNNLSWSFQCVENPPRRTGKMSGRVIHTYDPKTETVVQRHTITVDAYLVPPGRVIRATADQVQTARRVGDCQSSPRGPRPRN